MQRKCGNPGLKGKVLDKSIGAYILALEIINQLSVKYRIETFTYLICNAWELLLKAKIIDSSKNRKSIYYPKKRLQTKRSLSLSDCLKKVFINENDPVRRNLERMNELRDASVHLVINQVPKDVLGLFQASVLNYHKHLVSWFDVSLSDRVSVGMMTIVYDFNPQEFDLQSSMFRKKLGRDAFEYLSQYQRSIQKEFDDLGKPAEFSIDIGYKLGLVKKVNEGDIMLTQADKGTPMGILEVPKDPCKTHPYRRKDVVEKINTMLGATGKINGYDIDCAVKAYGLKLRTEFYYKGSIPGSPTQYSNHMIDWITKEATKDKSFFLKTRQKARTIQGIRITT
ncbi:MAG: hypothetical protein CO103_04235 [Chloroflexi bacterium CG_4_9_14_3_um_filter_45_9]|nr:MAG: hypothetical protein COT13_03045 [Chloroflexi bacterium CG08_land_8_20_14_0_20_45_12]PIX27141.1 MAG: hypothetical protein COZ67_03865 [Chloroflexi bacterium CG_4_8_14_3_um_filter_45_15]PJB49727.1 MAG: hypothetical protein CO103_04235 [Chloroflexi bacterium CG_4_9_14_3_um_filter_45_9]